MKVADQICGSLKVTAWLMRQTCSSGALRYDTRLIKVLTWEDISPSIPLPYRIAQ